MMTTTNNHLVADEAGVEIIPDTTVTATEESNVLVDAAAPPKAKWMTKGVVIAGIGGLLCVTGGGLYFLTGSPTSSKMTNFSSSNQMQQAAKKGRYKFKQFGDDAYCADSQSRRYPFISYVSDGVSSAEECGDICSKCPGNDQKDLVLRGFEYNPYVCACLVDFGISFDVTLCAGADGADPTYEGSGVIVNTRPEPKGGIGCWKVSLKGSNGRKSKSSKGPVRKLGQKNDSLKLKGKH